MRLSKMWSDGMWWGGMVKCCGGLYWIGVVGGECDAMW